MKVLFYDFEVFKNDWLVVFKDNEKFIIIVNDKDKLNEFIKEHEKSILVGFNSYNYDDIILAGLLSNKDPYELSKKIISGVKPKLKLNLITLDVMQELPLGVGLKSSEANMGYSIVETPIDFNLDRKLTKEELEQVITYCKNDVTSTEELFNKRLDYFQAKFEIVNEFSLPVTCIKNTRAVLASKVLKCSKIDVPHDRLHIDYSPSIKWNLIPKEVQDFFRKCEYDYRCGGDYNEIERRKLKLDIVGVPHVYGFGGLHGALEKYNGTGNYLHVDVSSYYPSLIIVNNFMSRASESPELFKNLRDMRYELKAKKDPKQAIYKILINSTFGAMKSEYNSLFDPRQANNICINGQIILTQLIIELSPYCELIQSNTDGLVVKYELKDYDSICNVVHDFEKTFNLTFDIDKISKIAQRDVNNYAIEFEDGHVEAKGRFSKFKGGNYQQNTLSIIDRCLVNYYLYNKPVHETIIETYKNNDLEPFQIIAKMGSTYDGMYYEYNDELLETQKVNRVFATKDTNYGGIYKKKGESYQRIANTSEHNIIHNEDIKTFDKSKLDLNYYIELCKNNLY